MAENRHALSGQIRIQIFSGRQVGAGPEQRLEMQELYWNS